MKPRAGRRAELRRRVDALKAAPCTDCGGHFPSVAMDFDHVRGRKRIGVARMVRDGYAWQAVWAEIAKCDLVCANCHRVRTAKRRVKWTKDPL